ncbi:MAG: DUF4440 domain-containing protein [Calditrichaceae bacterium]
MKKFTIISAFFLMITFILIDSAPVRAQEWSAAQKEVWKNVETYWQMSAKRDLPGFLSYFHNDYSGWYNKSAMPSGKASLEKWVAPSFATSKIITYDIHPLAIKIFGNVAFVHYYYMEMSEDKEGKRKSEQGRWTDILMKQNARWVLIGDHGGDS